VEVGDKPGHCARRANIVLAIAKADLLL